MKKSVCGADCSECGFGKNNNCIGCTESKGCPFGKKCFVYSYIRLGGAQKLKEFKRELTDEINGLGIMGLPELKDLYPMNGSYVNLAYPMPNGEKLKLLDDSEIYLCNQAECEFNDGEIMRCFGIVAGLDFILIAEYGKNGEDPELIVYKKR